MSWRAARVIGALKKLTELDKGLGARLPEAYKKFYKEWKFTKPAAVHYIPEEGKWKRDDVTGEVRPIQNYPIPVVYPMEHNEQMWGGEGVIQGFVKKTKYHRRHPHFWVPVLQRSVVYSEVLDKHFSVVLADRTLELIHSNYGLDHYLLKTLACDLKSLLSLKLKRKILEEIQNGCPSLEDRPAKQQEVLHRYKQYLAAYTPQEIEWYGYSFDEACEKFKGLVEAQNTPVPLKHVFRAQLIEKLKADAENKDLQNPATGSATWIEKINPFGKKHET